MRLDLYLYKNGFCDSRAKAQRVIEDERTAVNGKIVTKASYNVGEKDEINVLSSSEYEFVGRGGNKLQHAFEVFDFDAVGKNCLDIGASTGGFTECLLIHGAKKVYAVDSGSGQLSQKLRQDDRVVSIEGFNARALTTNELDKQEMDLIVMDVSFISQKLLYPAILNVAKKGADVITLIKPQFEAGKSALNKNGIVKDEKIRKAVVSDIIEYASSMNFEYISHADSCILGGDGNKEFLLHLKVK